MLFRVTILNFKEIIFIVSVKKDNYFVLYLYVYVQLLAYYFAKGTQYSFFVT